MKIVVRGENEVRVSAGQGELLVREEGGRFGPLEMLAAALARGTAEALIAWASQVGVDARDLAVAVRWPTGTGLDRVAAYEVDIDWRSLPAERYERARGVAEACPVHRTVAAGLPVEVAFGR